MYTDTGFWDTFRSLFPLLNFMYPSVNKEIQEGLINTYKESGFLPEWASPGHRGIMIGNNSASVVADAYLKGFTGFDAERAYNEIKKSITESKHYKSDWDIYDKFGYYPYDLIKVESVSRTLECGFDDYCMAVFAEKLGKTEDAAFFRKRADYYKNHYDKATNSMRPKDSKGKWLTPFDPYALAHADSNVGGHYTEGNALQYTWHVMQDIPGLIEWMGGKEKAGEVLDYLFNTEQESTGTLSDVTGLIGQYAHGNEPSHHVAYIYPYLDRPGETQRLVRKICTDFYKNKPDGLIGNDDCGQMSAWYMFSAMGFYPVNPVSGEFVLGAPQVTSASLDIGNGKWFTMEAKNLSKENLYVEKVELNGKPYGKRTITYKDIMDGSSLVFYMTSEVKK
jgi:predicted alpha-1,2-mannosidase